MLRESAHRPVSRKRQVFREEKKIRRVRVEILLLKVRDAADSTCCHDARWG